jgi:chromate transporter
MAIMKENKNLSEVASVFFKLGLFAFGGPAAHIAMMEKEVVEKRKWLSRDHFLDLIGATNLIPGPNSTEMTMHCGYERAGRLGLIVAGLSFIFPAIVTTGVLGWLYVTYGELPELSPFLYGIKPIVLAIIADAILKLGKKAIKGWELGILGALVLALCFAGVNEVVAMFSVGIMGGIYFYGKSKVNNKLSSVAVFPLLQIVLVKVTTLKVFLTFLKVGAILYGSGYVLFAYLDAELVAKGLLTTQELIDAIAIGQFTPGPVLSTATFIGFQLNGVGGALAASAGIFLPSFFFVLLFNPIVSKLRESKITKGLLDSVNVAAVAIMGFVMVKMGTETLLEWEAIFIALVGVFFTFGPKKVSTPYLVIIGVVLGYLVQLF